MNKGVFI